MAHNGTCKVCGRHIRIGDLSSNVNCTSKGMPVPFLLWLLPIPLISAWAIKFSGPKFCGDACKEEWRKQHPYAWIWYLIWSHCGIGILVNLA